VKNRNIWILNHYAHGPEYPGGTRHYTLARDLTRMGYDVTLFAADFLHPIKQQIRLQDGQPWGVDAQDGVRFVWLHTPAHRENDRKRISNMLAYTWRAVWYGPRLPRLAPDVPKPDVIIGSSVHLFAVVAAWWLARVLKAHFVMEVRDLWPQTLIDMGALREAHPLTRVLRGLERFLYRRAERIISVLPYAYRYIERTGTPASKVVWIPNGVDLSLYPAPTPMPARAPGQPFVLMYCGAHGVANHLEPLIEAQRILVERGRRDIQQVWVGNGPLKQAHMEQVKALNLDLFFTFRDPVPKGQLPQVLAQADATVLVMRDIALYEYGVSPNKMFDYMAAARPMLMAGSTANNPASESGGGIGIATSDPTAIADAIQRLADAAPEERAEMGRRAREYVERQHGFEVLSAKLAAMIESL
jgi:glycosyltransferase involved in cell wall biosynthesis